MISRSERRQNVDYELDFDGNFDVTDNHLNGMLIPIIRVGLMGQSFRPGPF